MTAPGDPARRDSPGDAAGWDARIAAIRAGDPEALRAFYELHRPAIERIAARAIAPSMLRRFGPESVAHSAIRTFLRRVEAGAVEIRDPDSLWQLLCAITLNKVRENARFHARLRRRTAGETTGDAADEALAAAASGEPDPADIAAFRDELEAFLASLDDEERRVVELRIAGRDHAEVAAAMRCSERTVRRIAARIEARIRGPAVG